MTAARIIDANANRAREALRVMEDAARFLLDDAALSGDLKSLRHDLRGALERLPPGWIEANRDTPGDVGTAITAGRERSRTDFVEVVIAAGKRLSEALRVIEEAGKTIDPDFARGVEALRYRAYDVEQRLQLRLGSGRARQWRVCVLLTESICTRSWEDVLRAIIDGGADCIQVREKDMDGGTLARRVRRVIELARPAGASVIVNDRADVALAAGADGVHVGEHDLSIRDVRRIAGRTMLIGASTHDLDEAKAAIEAGADYSGVGAMFTSALKPAREPSGPEYLRRFIEHYPNTPHLAIGGVGPENIDRLVDAGCRGVAVSSAVCAADDPARVVRTLREAIEADRSSSRH
ncbi:MAG: thiamine phosphate synthase [Planctomycetota bacterium]|nr:thiamine phosphate synthase [Planctomycetota bacterium]